MICVLPPTRRYPAAVQEAPALGDYVKLHIFLMQSRVTAGVWFRVTGKCDDGKFRGRGASSMVSADAEVRFRPDHVIEIRPPGRWYDRLLAWLLERDHVPC